MLSLVRSCVRSVHRARHMGSRAFASRPVDLTYQHYPCAQDGGSSLPPVVLMHGLLGSAANWRPTATFLAAKRDVYCLNLRNHGTSPHTDEMNAPAMVDDVTAFLDAHDIETCALLGHSMGGKVAMGCGLKIPERLERLVIVDTAPVSYEWDGQTSEASPPNVLNAMSMVQLESLTDRAQVDQVLQERLSSAALRMFVLQNLVYDKCDDGTRRMKWRVNLPLLIESLPLLSQFPYTLDDDGVEPYAGPTLFVDGEVSHYITEETHEPIRQFFPQSQIDTIPKCGHWVHVEDFTKFIASVEAFVNA